MKVKLISYILIPVAGVVLLCVVALCNTPYSALSIRGKTKKLVQGVLPQGWEFFTLDPRMEYFLVYKKVNNELVCLDLRNTASASFFGMSKLSRVYNIELEVLLARLDSGHYVSCRTRKEMEHIYDTLKAVSIRNRTNVRYFKGEYLIRKTKPVPWAWSNAKKEIFMPSKVVKVHVYE